MCYRLHPDAHGEVIAEDTDLDEKYLGLHYPAADLPDLARQHFERNQIRMLADVEAEPVAIIAANGCVDDLDLSFVKLRGITKAYRTYLRNMGAMATLSLPLVINDRLWGLIACHHQTPRNLPFASLHMNELAGQMISIFLEGQQNAKRFNHLVKAQELAFAISRRATGDEDFLERLTPFVSHLAELFEADSIVSRVDGKWTSLHGWQSGEIDFTPLTQHLEDGMFVADRLGEYLSIADDLQKDLAGGVYLSVADGDEDYLFLGRREFARTINWAGQRPGADGTGETAAAGDGDGASATSTFGRWQEEVRGRSRPYLANHRDTLTIVLQALRASLSTYKDRRMMAARAEMELLQAELRQQLLSNAGMASMSELAAALAHELNQPLTAISNFVNACRQMIRTDDIAVPAELASLMDDAVNESQRAGEIVRRLRNFIQQGELERVELDLSKTALETTKLALATKEIEPVVLVTKLDDRLPRIDADPVQIEQVVFNLVRNSLEAMASAKERTLTLSTRKANDVTVELAIEDTGPGIPKALLPTLFQPFRSSKPGGMGIGLSLCRSIIEAHDGRIFCGNTGTGARFWFTLPALKESGRHD
jgi:light-regulated signal transduction histidine kinase (bacteriophytochrome)